jgi:hypothetical protein
MTPGTGLNPHAAKRLAFKRNHAAFEKETLLKLVRVDLLLACPPVPPETPSFAPALSRDC